MLMMIIYYVLDWWLMRYRGLNQFFYFKKIQKTIMFHKRNNFFYN